MAKFLKKPVPVEATQWQEGVHHPGVSHEGTRAFVVTIHDQRAYLSPGDWLIAEPKPGRYYPCKPDIFAAIYEPAEGDRADEIADLKRAVAQGGDRVLRCAFCGDGYPPGTPSSHHERLAAHIFRCERHPLGKVARLADKLTDCLNEFSDNPGCCGEYVQALDRAIDAVRPRAREALTDIS